MTATTEPGLTRRADMFTTVPVVPGPDTTRRLVPPCRRPTATGRPCTTGEVPAWPTGAEVTVGFEPPPTGPPPPLPPQPAPPKRVGHYPPIPGSPPRPQPTPQPHPVPPPVADPPTERLTVERPKNYHPRHRECRCMPVRTIAALSVGTAALAESAFRAITWAVAQ